MPDPYAKVSPGQAVEFNANVWNDFLDAAKGARQRSLTSETSDVFRQGSIIRVKNESGADLLRTAIMGLAAPLFLPADDLNAFQNEVTFRVITPTTGHKSRFVVLLDPIANGSMGRAAIAGVVQVKVDILSAGHKCCDVADGITDHLVTLETGGSAQLLWQESGGGVKWAIVRLGNECVPPASRRA